MEKADNTNNKEVLHIKKEDSVFNKGQRDYLVFPNEMLVPGVIVEGEDYFNIELDTSGLVQFEDIMKAEGLDKYRLLIACGMLSKLRLEYSFSLNPANLMYDVNFIPKVKLRDGRSDADTFLSEYKALIGAVHAGSYTYDDYYKGGKDLYGKNPFLKNIFEATTVEEIQDKLYEEFSNLRNKLAKDNILVSKKKYKRSRRALPVLTVVIVALLALLGKYVFLDLPEKDTAIETSNQFLAADYIGVLNTLKEIPLSELTDEERYMAAYAGVVTASLSDKQQAAVVEGITLHTDSLFLDYWVEMGRGNYENAVDIAKRIGDSELELYGLIIEKDAVEANMKMDGAEKAATIKSLEEQIKALEEKAVQADETTPTDETAATDETTTTNDAVSADGNAVADEENNEGE